MKTKLFTLFFALMASVGTIFAQSGTCGDNLTWNLTDSVLTISGTGEISSGCSTSWQAYRGGIKYIIMENGISSIGYSAFSHCSKLISVEIPNSVTSIGTYAFYYCSSLASVTIPNSVTSIGSSAFSGCSGMTSITIPNSVISIASSTFEGCRSLTSINVASDNPSYSSIGGVLFNKEQTTLVRYPIAKNGSTYTIPNSVLNIGNYAFQGCINLTSILIPNSVTSIGHSVFVNFSNLISIDVANDNPNYCSIDGVLFNKDQTTLIRCPEGNPRSEYIIPSSVTNIDEGAFHSCHHITSVEMPNSIINIGGSAFNGCGITSVVIPNSVISIGSAAFYYDNLMSVIIGKGVTSIGESAFYQCCSWLPYLTCEAIIPPTLGNWAFDGVDKTIPLYVPAESVAAYQTADGWRNFTNIQAIASTEDPSSNPQTTIAPPIFECDSYYWLEADTTIYNSGEYTHTFTSWSGCDSVVIQPVTIVYSTISEETYYGCDYIIVRGRTYFTSGLYMDTLVNAAGCDSIILMDITMSTSFNVIAPPVTAEGSYYWAEADTTITTSGIYTHNFYSWFGCDSIVTLDVTILEPEPGNLCDAPTELRVANMYNNNAGTVSLSWNGTTDSYEVKAYSYEYEQWYGPKIVNGTQTSFNNLPAGQTDFYVRAICGENEYSSEAIATKLLYYSDLMAVDYLDLDNAICYVNNSTPTDTRTFNDFRQVPAVNYGPSDINSRHTIHYDRNETEPRTGGMAKTIPDGELASVRLGNWDSGAQAERIEFSFAVDTLKYPVLLLKYLPILEAPSHDDYENPRIKVDLLINGQSLGDCVQLDINANDAYTGSQLKPGAAADGWHITSASVAQTSADIVWKDWTTIGFNLRNRFYQGKTLTVRITSFDCAYSAHCGYVYFTLGVSDGRLMDMNCGQINPELKAPDGFNYRWMYASNEKYRQRDGSIQERYILSRSQTFNAGMQDDSLYVVDCMFAQDSTCFFSLYATPLATEPVTKMNRPQIVRNEQNNTYEVTFDASLSYVQEIDHVTGDTLVSRMSHIESYEWNVFGIPYGWSDDVSPTYTFPDGGIYEVTLRVTSGTCESLLQYNLQLQQDTGETIEPTDSIYDVVYLDQAGLQLDAEPIILHLPVAPVIEGFSFLKWQVVAGDLENGIYIQAVYTANEPTNAPEVYTNPANKAQKLIRNGKVYILTDDKVYSISGQKVK